MAGEASAYSDGLGCGRSNREVAALEALQKWASTKEDLIYLARSFWKLSTRGRSVAAGREHEGACIVEGSMRLSGSCTCMPKTGELRRDIRDARRTPHDETTGQTLSRISLRYPFTPPETQPQNSPTIFQNAGTKSFSLNRCCHDLFLTEQEQLYYLPASPARAHGCRPRSSLSPCSWSRSARTKWPRRC